MSSPARTRQTASRCSARRDARAKSWLHSRSARSGVNPPSYGRGPGTGGAGSRTGGTATGYPGTAVSGPGLRPAQGGEIGCDLQPVGMRSLGDARTLVRARAIRPVPGERAHPDRRRHRGHPDRRGERRAQQGKASRSTRRTSDSGADTATDTQTQPGDDTHPGNQGTPDDDEPQPDRPGRTGPSPGFRTKRRPGASPTRSRPAPAGTGTGGSTSSNSSNGARTTVRATGSPEPGRTRCSSRVPAIGSRSSSTPERAAAAVATCSSPRPRAWSSGTNSRTRSFYRRTPDTTPTRTPVHTWPKADPAEEHWCDRFAEILLEHEERPRWPRRRRRPR